TSSLQGPTCEESVRGCDSEPCRNGGRCQNIPGGFQCYCSPEYGGETCDKAVKCLVDGSYCLNGGRCVRGLSTNHCECAGNFTGTHCERSTVVPLQEPCDLNPCLNGGTCHVDDNIAICECPVGFAGENCSEQQATTSSSCTTNPCQNGGSCQAVGDPLEDGFLCSCPIGFEGNLCEQVASEWQSSVEEVTLLSTGPMSSDVVPTTTTSTTSTTSTSTTSTTSTTQLHQLSQIGCDMCVHSDRCVESPSGALCVCHAGYQGNRCDQPGEPCDLVSCIRPLVCQPLIAVSGTRTTCKCPIGWTGPKCLQNTAVSFDESSLFIHQSPSVMIGSSSGPLPYSLSFAMRTTAPTVHVASGENIFGQQLFSIGLSEGQLVVTVHGTTFNKLIPFVINDGAWYAVKLEKSDQDVLISVNNEAGYQLLSRSLPRMTSFDVFATRVGKIGDSEYFVGCLADFSLDEGNAINLAMSSRGTGITQGCKHEVQCSKNPCLNGGSCLDFWTHSSCICPPPFLPPLCMNSLPPSTFGHLNQTSFAEITIPSEMSQSLRFSTAIQMILRSNQPNGTVLFLGETGDDLATFISISLVDGHVVVRSRAGSKTVHELKSHRVVTDNKDHIIRVRRQRRQVKLEIDEVLDSEGTIPSRFDHPLFAERLQLGSGRNVTDDAFTNDNTFKGSLQDIRINEKSAVLHEPTTFAVERLGDVADLENVLEGTISDDICGMADQCVHGSCQNTFNDFECRCQKGYFGRRCERKDHCMDSPCPAGGTCDNVGNGYICTSPVTLKTVSTASFKMSEPIETSSVVKLSIRTHSENGRILTLKSEEGSFTLSLTNGQPVVIGVVPVPIRKTIADGQWHKLELNENVLYVDSASYGLPEMAQLPSRIRSVMLEFGAVDEPSFDGCLKDITIGELPRLSFYKGDEFGHPSNVTFWMIDKRVKVATSCLSSQQCGEASPCIRGECHDLWNAYACECPHGFEGTHCEVKRDECAKTECGRGQCVNGIEGPRCHCDLGFTGQTCDVEMDLCSLIPCKNAGLCTSSNGNYTCECKSGWTGKSCDIRDQSVCSDKACNNGGTCETDDGGGIKCICKAGFFGRFCEERIDPCAGRPCDHGYCKPSDSADFECECEEGYTGKTCSVLSDMCTTSSCSGRGRCAPVWNATMCTCDKRWKGAACTHLVDECLSIPCENDGTCETTEEGFKCHCRKYYLGDRCELQGTCLTHPCERGECIQLSYDSHSCSCPKGYEGTRCE
ncbi:EGF-like domain protein, partial [Cooperia oncophora]